MMPTPAYTLGTHIGAALCFVIPVAVVAMIVLAARRSRRARRAQAAAAWQALIMAAGSTAGAHLCHVSNVYQRAHRGAKATIVWADTGVRQDTWFWYFWPAAGSTLLVRGTVGFGPHNRNPAVLYVQTDGVLAGAPPGAQAAWQRLYAAVNR